jgi:hypothetical protein
VESARADDLTDHETAEAIRDGKMASPTKYGDFWLFDLRITGTGAAYRDALDEWAVRDPKEWLHDDFVNRCNGLPVIFEHPERSGLDSKEFGERAIGTVVLPYVKGDEVWGIAKIFNSDAAQVMQTTHRSTSPGVTPPKGSVAAELKDGSKVLAEGLPLVLDHLAICAAGVWDKDGPPEGIRLDRKDLSVADEDLEKVKKERDDAKAALDSANSKMDAMVRADAARKDADEKERDDKRRKDESDKEAIAAAEKEKDKKDAADSKKRDSRKDRHAKHDGNVMDCARCDSEESEEKEREEKERDDKAKKDAAAAKQAEVDAERGTQLHDSKFAELTTKHNALQVQNAEMLRRLDAMNVQPSIDDSNEIAKAWARWDSLYQMLGDQTPRAYPGEAPRAYLRRLADGVRKYTQSFANYAFHDAQQVTDFGLVADAIFAEALAHSKKPIMDKPGFLREVVTHPHGKTRTEFIGDHRTPWLPFMHPTKFAIAKINRPSGNVYS